MDNYYYSKQKHIKEHTEMTQQEKYDQLYEEIKAINDEKQGIIKKL